MIDWGDYPEHYTKARCYAMARSAVAHGTMSEIPAHLRAWREEVIRLGIAREDPADTRSGQYRIRTTPPDGTEPPDGRSGGS